MGSSTKYGWTMSACRKTKSGDRMCSMFRSDPVSRLSTQMTRWPRRRSSSHRCEPKNPAPPVTRQVDMSRLDYGSRAGDFAESGRFPAHRLALASLAQVALAQPGVEGPGPRPGAVRQPLLGQAPEHDGAAPAARPALAAALLDLDGGLRHRRVWEGTAMPAPAFAAALNEQVGHEFAAHQQYVAIAVHYDAETLPRLAAFFYAQALEERNHAMMMVQYLLDSGAEVVVPGTDAPRSTFADIVEPVQTALDQERRVTDQISALTALARETGDFQSEQFLGWFLKEQVEEVASMGDLLRVVQRAKDDPLRAEEHLAREQASGEGEDPTAPAAAGGAV